jgi:hypothetical protein
MTVDYDVYLGLGRQIKIVNYDKFPYTKFDELVPNDENDEKSLNGFKIILTSQEYKGTNCLCTLFIGKILHKHDLRDTTVLPVKDTLSNITNADLTSKEKRMLNQACELLETKLDFDEESFGPYGISLLVRCW